MIIIYLDDIKDAYLDGTDALVNRSVNYLIHEDENRSTRITK